MKNFRKGSALLVVLGMLSFMVISAVAFSAYMRYSRLPSSYLRQAAASRLLAKAAVAEAIEEIDAAIGNMPHPGLWNKMGNLTATENTRYTYPRRPVNLPQGLSANDLRLNRNIWMDRVYIGNNGDRNQNDPLRHLVEPFVPENDDGDSDAGTVSPLCLEALAYIPAPLLNSARYYSRRSNAAKWHKLAFDAGRYAFCAIDVSDYLDVNSLAANVGRSSSSAGRISLAHIFENPEKTPGDTSAHTRYETMPDTWDQYMKKFRTMSVAEAEANGQSVAPNPSLVPLISVADLNLSLYYNGFQDFSPFSKYVDQNLASILSGYDNYGIGGKADLRQLTLVTDGWYPSSKEDITKLDLADPVNQPFPASMLQGENPIPAGTIMDHGSVAAIKLRDKISRIGLLTLYDYLDENSIPASLAIPQVERTPMICGFQQRMQGSKVEISNNVEPASLTANDLDAKYIIGGDGKTTRTVVQTTTYKINGSAFTAGLMGGMIKPVVAYPFHRGVDVESNLTSAYNIDGHVAIFFSTGETRFRCSNDATWLRIGKSVGASLGREPENVDVINGVFHVLLPKKMFNFRSANNPQSEQEALKDEDIELIMQKSAGPIAEAIESVDFLRIVRHIKQRRDPDASLPQWEQDGEPEIKDIVCEIPPLTSDGLPDPSFTDSKELMKWINGSKDVTVRAAVWLRISDDRSGPYNTVDMVPANMMDDQDLLNVNNNLSMGPEGGTAVGKNYPLMLFTGGSFKFGLGQGCFEATDLDFIPKGVMCPDPRWNWAPEHWYVKDNVDKNTWYQEVKQNFLGKTVLVRGKTYQRNLDLYMSTSDSGYMQSVYELAFLPRLTDLRGDGGSRMGWMQAPEDDRNDWASSSGGIQNRDLMWLNYRPYATNVETDPDPFEDVGIVNQGSGVKVNPYSDDTNVVMAVFANTPFDWWAASTNFNVGVPQSERKNAANQFNKKYAFNQISGNSNAKFAWKDLKRVARNFMINIREGLRSESDYSWEDAYDDLDWSGTFTSATGYGDYFCTPVSGGSQAYDNDQLDSQTDALWEVDRKFLYGYWRDCFAAKQQLFLIFVRAEPMMLGGGAIGQTPPALGARAVALVWRDPNDTQEDCGNGQPRPHRTRILFYRQFE